MADRYTYIPSIGFFIAIVFLARDFALQIKVPKIIAAGVAAVILTACILGTEFQLQFWRDSETLFRRAVTVTQNNGFALVNLGVALEEHNRFEEALAAYLQAEKIDSGLYQIHYNLGNVLSQLGRHAESLAEYHEAIQQRPDLAILHNAAGAALTELGQFDAALKEFSEAERLDPHFAAPHVGTAKVFFAQGRDTEAVDELRAALRIEPDNFEILVYAAHYLAANENAAARDGKTALVLALKANALSGNSQPQVFDMLGMALAATGDFTNAQTCAQNALELATAAQMKNTGQISRRLELYKNHQPWLESFRATNAPVKN
jgi:tetratricopeptide (TPR) repeat protein